MRVLHFLDTINLGGAEILGLDVFRNALNSGLDLTFVTASGGALEKEFSDFSAKFIRLERKSPVDFNLVRKLRRIIKENDIQIVHAHQAVEALHLYLATLNLKNVKRVLSFHGYIPDTKNYYSLRFLFPRMNANIVVCRQQLDWLKNSQNFDISKNFSIIYNGTDLKRLKNSQKSLKEELGLAKETPLIGMVANFYREERKDHLTVCKALPRIFAEVKDAHCLFVGKIEPGAEQKFADCVEFCRSRGFAERVHFLDARTDIPDVLASLEVFILSSIQEGMPIALIEAMLIGVPTVVSDILPFVEITDEGKYAEIFQVRDADELAERVLKLLQNKNLKDNLAISAQKFAQENFTIEAHLQNLKSLYERILIKSQV